MDDFLCGLTGRVVLPIDPTYQEARQSYNRAIQQYPLILVYCRNKKDVSNAVKWSRRHSVPIRIRNGGHNYEGYSNGDCTLIIDLSEMTCMDLNKSTNQIYLEGGVTNIQVYEFMASKGYPFPGGTCPTVGVGGYALGGGWGLSCRYLGLGCDSLEEIELVNYKGIIKKANRKSNSDLFWACRGAGGGNFGVIVSMKFRLPPRVRKVTLIEIDYLNVSTEEQEVFLQTWQEWLKDADSKITLISRIYNSPEDGLAMLVRGIFYGDPCEAKQSVRDFLILDKAVYNIEYLTFLEAVTIIGSTYPTEEKFQSVSRFVLRSFDSNEISEVVNLIKKRSKGSVFCGLSMYALGGKVSEVDIDNTAFFYRKARFIIWLETIWEDNDFAEVNIEWIKNRFPYLESVTEGSYVNFPYKYLPDYLDEYYGNHVELLRKIKKEYDPFNIFSFPQGIKATGDCYLPLLQNKRKDVSKSKININHRRFRYVAKR
ncbi:MAG: FAD-linked oxidase [Firmicutes bacterium HGW-Firmicutes-7]|nr:MAG: FAD-linked oxidase [Firmicutes bacterium HGW-Firmicutes-7]